MRSWQTNELSWNEDFRSRSALCRNIIAEGRCGIAACRIKKKSDLRPRHVIGDRPDIKVISKIGRIEPFFLSLHMEIEKRKVYRGRVGVFGIGLAAYWPQFPD